MLIMEVTHHDKTVSIIMSILMSSRGSDFDVCRHFNLVILVSCF